MNLRSLFSLIFLFGIYTLRAQHVGPPSNVGREYGNPTMPLFVSHIPDANRAILSRGSTPHHTVFGMILCFRKVCRIQIGHTKSLHAISFKKFKKKISKNMKKGLYKKPLPVPTRHKLPVPVATPPKPDSLIAQVDNTNSVINAPVLKADSLIVLGGELLFEVNSSTLMSEHFVALNSIAEFLTAHPTLIVKISGYTDSTGKESHNLTLSRKRADVVAEYLVDNGVSISRVSSEGLGSSKPIAPNTTEVGRKKNRRVELLMHDGR